MVASADTIYVLALDRRAAIPRDLYAMRSLRELNIGETPQLHMIPAALKSNSRAVLDYLIEQSHVRVNRVHLLLIGHTGSGKTTLLHALRTGKPLRQLPDLPATIGVDISTYAGFSPDNRAPADRLVFSVRDFSGHTDYFPYV